MRNWRTGLGAYGEVVPSSMYEELCVNVPAQIMEFPDFSYRECFEGEDYNEALWHVSFPNSEVHHEYVKRRIQKYDMIKNIRFETEIDHVRELPDGKFEVTIRNLKDKTVERRVFDYVNVCVGHFTIPNMPDYPGIDKVKKARVLHSRDIKDCRVLKDRTVFILGAGFSAEDIGQMAVKFGAKRIYFSSFDDPYISKGWPDYVTFHQCLKEIVSIHSNDPKEIGEEIHLVDGTIIRDVDDIVFATGFHGVFPFMHQDIALNLS